MKNPGASFHREEEDDDEDEELEDGKSHTLDERGRKPKASSEKEKEKTKIRERHRRSITTKILTGLRKYGNYNLPPRADVNDVLRALATEAGWVVEADGTTYRSPALQQTSGTQSHPGLRHISSLNRVSLNPGSMTLPSLTPTPSVSSLGSMGGFNSALPPIITDPIDPRGGDCSTTASPRHISSSSINLLHPNSALSSPFTSPASSEGGQSVQFANPFLSGVFPSGFLSADGRDVLGIRDDTAAAFLSGDMMEPRELLSGRSPVGTPTSSLIGSSPSNLLLNPAQTGFYPAPLGPMSYNTKTALPSVMMFPQQHPFLQESRASNQNTPIGSPQPHGGNM